MNAYYASNFCWSPACSRDETGVCGVDSGMEGVPRFWGKREKSWMRREKNKSPFSARTVVVLAAFFQNAETLRVA